jgi:uncharacterized membrane protein
MYPESTRNFESNKILGGVGALLTAIGSLVLFSGTVGIVGIVGIILVLISMRGLAEDFKDYSIYRNAFHGFIFGVIGIIIAIAVFAAFSFFSGFIFAHPIVGVLGILGAIVGWGLMFVFFLVSGIFYKIGFNVLASKSREGTLRTGSLLLLIGSILTIVFVGFFLLFVAWILIAVGLFSLKSTIQPAQAYTAPQMPPTSAASASEQVKYCPHCGAENKLEGTFCTHCGRRLNL